ncbi:MAG: 30S ribosomal protein S17 [Leptonema sp. (in: Bacteria)]|nr:30S ribosomal protein S17 [Leptonema sp. (in: bacteria)]
MKERSKNFRIVQGKVVSDVMDKTRVILLETFYTHPKFKKIIKVSRRLKVHDEKNESKTNDIIQAIETRPLSRQKRHRLFKIIARGQL